MDDRIFRCVLAVVAIIVAGCGDPQAVNDMDETAAVSPDASGSVGEPAPATADAPAGPEDAPLGPALDDPARYYGVYAAPERPARDWFIAEAKRPAYAERAPEVPPGHLMLGAMFGDVAPWHLQTLSETEFVQAHPGPGQPEPVAIEFRLDDSGRASAFRFTGGGFSDESWLVRTGDLPDGW